jgi:hypothetical protein
VSKVGSCASSNADFERFVYADVAIDPNGMELSVLSALSRRGLDPWQEAQRLAQLPPFAAADGLAQILRVVSAVQALRLDVNVIAQRLVALLPFRGTVTGGQFPSKLASAPVQVPRGTTLMIMGAIFGSLLMALFLRKQAEPVAPTSWIADALKAPVKPRAVPGAISQFDPTRSPWASAATTPPPSVP